MSFHEKITSEANLGNIPLAIVGMSCMFPKASGKQSFWRVLRQGENCITEIPSTHWSVADLYDGDASSPDRTYCKVGGFLEPYQFDASEFAIPPNTLEATDTSQLLALVGAKEALRDAGYGEGLKEVPKEKTSVILGVTGCLELVIPLGARLGHPYWRKALYDAGIDEETAQKIVTQIANSYVGWQENSFPGLLGNVVAGRVANKLDLHGTNCVVDAACASSLAALHLGMMELQTGSADMVISGGVDTFNDIFMFECFSKTPALSHANEIHPFSENSDGTLLGEGVGIVILKRLSDAERDGDKIYAIIKGIGSSSDGSSGAIYAPDAAGQRRAVERAYANAKVDPATLSIIEAHGTGTKKGDIVEFEGLQQFFAARKDQKQWCALGTVKSQIGHTKAAAGSASLCKMALAIYNKVLLPTINVSRPHPNLHIEESAFYLNNISRPWLADSQHPRRCALSSFGFGGSNFHVILEEYRSERLAPAWDGSVLIFAYSAGSKEELLKKIDDDVPKAADNPAWQAHQSCASFDHQQLWKAAAVCAPGQASGMLADLSKALREGAELPAGCFSSDGQNDPHKMAFLFPGQGSQYLHMGSELAAIFPEVLQAFQKAEELLPEDQRPYAKIFPLPSYDAETEQAQLAALTDTKSAQVALGTLEMSTAAVLRSFGAEPQAAAGHSYGELVALQTAGRLSPEELFQLSALRGRLMSAGDGGRGGMIAVSASEDIAEEIAKEAGLTVANRNHPKQFVLTGLKENIKKAQAIGKERKVTARPLQVSAAFHSSLMASAVEPFAQALEKAEFPPSDIPVYANLSGDIYPESAAEARHTLSQQLVNSVNFITIIENMYARGFDTFVEVGPKAVLGGLVKGIMNGRPYHMMATDSRKGGGELVQLAKCLAELACLGFPVRLSAWEERPTPPQKKKFPVTICGANYRKPGSVSPAPWPDPKQPVEGYCRATPKIKPPAILPTEQKLPAEAVKSESSVSSEKKTPKNIVMNNNNPVSSPQPQPQPQPAANASADAINTINAGLAALQALQQQTAYAHQRFLDNQAQLQYALQNLLAVSQQYLAQASRMPLPMLPAFSPLAPMMFPGIPAAYPPPAPPAFPAQLPFMGYPTAPLAAPAPLTAPAPSATPAPLASNLQKQVKAAHPPAAPNSEDLKATVLSIVSDKTGYPAEMITADMDMEADLGIDSIKRVEILAALEERLPNIKTITPDEIGSLHTLQQIIERLGGHSDKPSAPSLSPNAVPQASAPSEQPNSSQELTGQLLQIVSEKTGYPAEMISVDMDMEADLGIDSIKRVEILAAVEERIPGLSSISPEDIGSLHTLKQVLERLQSGNSAASAASSSAVSESAQPALSGDMAVSSDRDFIAAVMQVVAEKTGYPAEMLNLDMDIESDLGIDSIKRVEILAAIEEKFPKVNSISPEDIGNLRTLRQIVERLRPFDPTTPPEGGPQKPNQGEGSNEQAKERAAEARPQANASANSLSQTAIANSLPPLGRLERRVLRYREALPHDPIGLPGGSGPYLLLDDGQLAPYAQAVMEERGAVVYLASPDQVARFSPRNFRQSELSASDRRLQKILPSLKGLIVFIPRSEQEGWDDTACAAIKDSFLALQAAAPALSHGRSLFATVSRLDGRMGTGGGLFNPIEGGLHSLGKVVAQEWPECVCRAIDLDPGWDLPEAAAALIDELSRPGVMEVGLLRNSRIIPELSAAPFVPHHNRAWEPGQVIVVSGGARGVTADCVKTMARYLHPTFILLGRSPLVSAEAPELTSARDSAALKGLLFQQALLRGEKPTPAQLEKEVKAILANREIQATLDELQQMGCRAEYISLDVRDRQAVADVLEKVRQKYGAIHGIIHAAGVLADRKITDKTIDQFNAVFDTKIYGLLNLLQASRSDELKFLAFFSSVTARFGRPGQSDYAIANEIMNKAAHLEAILRPHTQVVSIGWGPWDGGMVNDGLRREFAKIGAELIPRDEGALALTDEMVYGDGREQEIIVGTGFNLPSEDDICEKSYIFPCSFDIMPILNDHAFGGQAVLPMAFALEYFAQAATERYPRLNFVGVDDLQIRKPIAIVHGRQAVVVCESAISAGTMLRVPVRLQIDNAVHASASVILSTAADGQFSPENTEIFRGDAVPDFDAVDAYERFLFHGISFQGLASLKALSPEGAVAAADSAPLPSAWWLHENAPKTWITEPLLADCALQLGLIWSGALHSCPSLPLGAQRYRQFTEVFPEQVTLALRITEHKGMLFQGEVVFCDKERVLAVWQGIRWMMDASLKEQFKNRYFLGVRISL
ncbi:MAG: SDR family oxidoreductase [bacterium]|nr:SDR family oxidoreductase [bacterium]